MRKRSGRLRKGGWIGRRLLRGGEGGSGDQALSGPFCCGLDDLRFAENQCSRL